MWQRPWRPKEPERRRFSWFFQNGNDETLSLRGPFIGRRLTKARLVGQVLGSFEKRRRASTIPPQMIFTVNSNFNYNNNRRFNNNGYEQHATPVRTPTRHPKQQQHTANLLASLDKSILQIRDWLTLLEGMIKKDRVDLADRGHIYHMLERQKVRIVLLLLH